MLLPYFASKEDDPESQPSGLTVLLKHKPLLVLALALAVFHLGNAAIVPLFRMSAVSGDEANGPSFVATIVVIARGVMVVASVVAMQVAEKRNYRLILLASFLVLPLRGLVAFFLSGWWGSLLSRSWTASVSACRASRGARHGGALAVRNRSRQSRARCGHYDPGRGRGLQPGARRMDRAGDRLLAYIPCARRTWPPRRCHMGRPRCCGEAILGGSACGTIRNLSYLLSLIEQDMEEETMDGLIYLIGLIVVIMAILSFFGLR
jgi:hypothetical protein